MSYSLSREILGSLTMCSSSVDVLVIGAGPTGLGAAKRLNQIVPNQILWVIECVLTPEVEWSIMVDYRLQ